MHVWESKCRACYGTGSVTFSSRRGKRSTAICPSCTGMGESVARLILSLATNTKEKSISGDLIVLDGPLDELKRAEEGNDAGGVSLR